MTAQPRFRPVLVHDADREVGMGRCPSEEVLILYATALPDDEVESVELLDGWTLETISTHLGGCEGCRHQVAALGELTGALRGDRLQPPRAAFWDDLTASVMQSIDGTGGASIRPGTADVIPLYPDETREPEPGAAERESASPRWSWRARAGWAAAAIVLLGFGIALVLAREPRGGGDAPEPVADGSLVPTADEAAALAAELGIDLAPADSADLYSAGGISVGDAIDEAGWSSLRRDLEQVDDVDALELALVEDDPIEDLIELDAEELTQLLEALESRT